VNRHNQRRVHHSSVVLLMMHCSKPCQPCHKVNPLVVTGRISACPRSWPLNNFVSLALKKVLALALDHESLALDIKSLITRLLTTDLVHVRQLLLSQKYVTVICVR